MTNLIDITDLTGTSHRARVAEEVGLIAAADRSVTAEVTQDAIELFDLHVAMGSQYANGTDWAEVWPGDVAAEVVAMSLARLDRDLL